MRKILVIAFLCASVLAIPAGCSQPKGLADRTRISPTTHVASGQMLEAQRNFPGAETQYQRAIDAQPDLTIAYHRLAELYLKLGRYNEARQTLRTAIEAGADEASLRNNLGFTLLRLEQYDEAEQMFEAALAISPDFHRARMNLALLHARAGRIDASVAEFEKLLPRSDALYNVAVIRMQQRDYLTAAWGFGEAAMLNPNLPQARQQYEKARFLAQRTPQSSASPEFLAALNVPTQPTEPQVVHTTSARSEPTPSVVAKRESTQPARRTTTTRRAAIEPRIAEAPVTPRLAEPTPNPATPILQAMRDISSKAPAAIAAGSPTTPANQSMSAQTTTSMTAPAPKADKSEIVIAKAITKNATPAREPTDTNDATPDCEETTPMTPVQLTSAHPTTATAAQPMTPVTTE
ncbi:MAG TPA: tetratricopeptide repeat protein [Phycisphaerae bacterium]|nr:tetratricopeptide repeat protein [Phycisphaerae bacterium]HRW51695.1 tetratricopeptide repeat protein [Phycisphaerae bacterium]